MKGMDYSGTILSFSISYWLGTPTSIQGSYDILEKLDLIFNLREIFGELIHGRSHKSFSPVSTYLGICLKN
ncbi:MAG: hypothetical protein DRN78_05180 [Thermoproteota archaeon]|nr:MAG: hypothetical protein DRN78_05180 [Candidatus Korarchaeota archaeon]